MIDDNIHLLGGLIFLGISGCAASGQNTPAACGADAPALRRLEIPTSERQGVAAFMQTYRPTIDAIEGVVPSICEISSSEKLGPWRGYWVMERSEQFFLRAVELNIEGKTAVDAELKVSRATAEKICATFGPLVRESATGSCPSLPRGGRWVVVSLSSGRETAYGGIEMSAKACTAARMFDSLSTWFQAQRWGVPSVRADLDLQVEPCSLKDLPDL